MLLLMRMLIHSSFAGDAPGALHERQMRRTLAVLLTDPIAPEAVRQAVDASTFDDRVYAQAMLPPRRSGLGSAPVCQTADASFVAQGLALLSFLFTHHAVLHLPADLASADGLPWMQQLRAAAGRLPVPRSGDGAGTPRACLAWSAKSLRTPIIPTTLNSRRTTTSGPLKTITPRRRLGTPRE